MAATEPVKIMPRVISWFGMPVVFGDTERFELLKRDIFLHNARFEELNGLWAINSRFTAFAFNLDKILEYLPFPRLDGVLVLAHKLIRYISRFCPHNSIVHTKILNQDIQKVFNDHGIKVLQQNLEYRPNAYQVLTKELLPLVQVPNRAHREHVRICFSEDSGYKATIKIIDPNGYEVIIAGYLKDLSLNGAGIKVPDVRLFRLLPLKKAVRIYIRHPYTNFQISQAYVTRRNEDTHEVGVNFSINEESFISRHDAYILTRTVYSHLQEFFAKKIKNSQETDLAFRISNH